jgi:hypothetical protein
VRFDAGAAHVRSSHPSTRGLEQSPRVPIAVADDGQEVIMTSFRRVRRAIALACAAAALAAAPTTAVSMPTDPERVRAGHAAATPAGTWSGAWVDGPSAAVQGIPQRAGRDQAGAPAAQSRAGSDAGAWKVFAIGAGAVALLLCAVELITLSRLRRATAI